MRMYKSYFDTSSFILFLCFLLSVEEHEVHAYNHERNAEPLSHIQWHAILEIYLVLFQEFHEEAEHEYLCETEAKKKPRCNFLP